jgi:hypothetical protein
VLQQYLAVGEGADMIILELEMPHLIPFPANDSEPAVFTPDDTELVVLPTANRDNNGLVAAVDAEIRRIPAAAPVVDIPTETIPAQIRIVGEYVYLRMRWLSYCLRQIITYSATMILRQLQPYRSC